MVAAITGILLACRVHRDCTEYDAEGKNLTSIVAAGAEQVQIQHPS